MPASTGNSAIPTTHAIADRLLGQSADPNAGSRADALVDASSAILLFKAGLIEFLVDAYRVVMAASVFSEVSRPGYPGARDFMRLKTHRRIRIENPDTGGGPAPDPPWRDAALHAGERDTLRLYAKGRGRFVLIDDGRGAAICRDNGIPYINALLFPRLLMFSGRLDAGACLRATDTIRDQGRYSRQILHFVDTCTPAELDFFLPKFKELNFS